MAASVPLIALLLASLALVAGAPTTTTSEAPESSTSTEPIESTIITTTAGISTTTADPSPPAKGFCERYGLEEGCLWKTGAGFGVLLVYAAVLFAFISVGCTDRGWCVVIK